AVEVADDDAVRRAAQAPGGPAGAEARRRRGDVADEGAVPLAAPDVEVAVGRHEVADAVAVEVADRDVPALAAQAAVRAAVAPGGGRSARRARAAAGRVVEGPVPRGEPRVEIRVRRGEIREPVAVEVAARRRGRDRLPRGDDLHQGAAARVVLVRGGA